MIHSSVKDTASLINENLPARSKHVQDPKNDILQCKKRTAAHSYNHCTYLGHIFINGVTAPSNLQDLDYFIHVYDGGVI
jgi:hypothetical protein